MTMEEIEFFSKLHENCLEYYNSNNDKLSLEFYKITSTVWIMRMTFDSNGLIIYCACDSELKHSISVCNFEQFKNEYFLMKEIK